MIPHPSSPRISMKKGITATYKADLNKRHHAEPAQHPNSLYATGNSCTYLPTGFTILIPIPCNPPFFLTVRITPANLVTTRLPSLTTHTHPSAQPDTYPSPAPAPGYPSTSQQPRLLPAFTKEMNLWGDEGVLVDDEVDVAVVDILQGQAVFTPGRYYVCGDAVA